MPNRDHRGPRGEGPATGRGMGPCAPRRHQLDPDTLRSTEFSHYPGLGRGRGAGRGGMGRGMGYGMGHGMGRGMGRGLGRGMGRGMGHGRGFADDLDPRSEREALERERDLIDQRLAALAKDAPSEKDGE